MTPMEQAGRTGELLRAAALTADWPATPDVRAAVMSRIMVTPEAAAAGAVGPTALGGRRGTRGSSVLRRKPAMRALALAIVALLVIAGVATALGYRLPGLDVLFVERLPPAGTGLDLGSRVALDDVLDLGQPSVRLPALLPKPEAAFVLGTGDRSIVTVAWRAVEDQPKLAGSDLALTLMAVAGKVDESLIRKLLGPETTIEPVTVGGDRGWWISGAPHEILVLRDDGSVGLVRSAIVGDTLVFARDGTLYRLESALGRDATIAIAQSIP